MFGKVWTSLGIYSFKKTLWKSLVGCPWIKKYPRDPLKDKVQWVQWWNRASSGLIRWVAVGSELNACKQDFVIFTFGMNLQLFQRKSRSIEKGLHQNLDIKFFGFPLLDTVLILDHNRWFCLISHVRDGFPQAEAEKGKKLRWTNCSRRIVVRDQKTVNLSRASSTTAAATAAPSHRPLEHLLTLSSYCSSGILVCPSTKICLKVWSQEVFSGKCFFHFLLGRNIFDPSRPRAAPRYK